MGVGLRYKKDRESRKTQNPTTAMRAQEGWEVKRVSEVKRAERRERETNLHEVLIRKNYLVSSEMHSVSFFATEDFSINKNN